MTERMHFIGVGGSGMSAVARLVAARGVTVSGSDQRESAYFLALREAGMDVRIGHDATYVEGVDAVVISTAVRETNPELARARELGIRVLHRSEALAFALEDDRLVAVAGSHGKTTTSAMVAHTLHRSGIDASFAVGARVFGVEGAVAGGYAGTAGIGVVEADESDGSFLRYDSEVGILLNIEPDHLDHYGSVERLEEAFAQFALGCRVLIACAEDATVMRIADQARDAGVDVITYGFEGSDADVQVSATHLSVTSPLSSGEMDPSRWPQPLKQRDGSISRDGEVALDGPLRLTVPVPGSHQRLNAAAAWAAAVVMGADALAAADALSTFAGTGRRYQLRGEVGGVRVVDDYAHHPTEVAAVLAAARSAGQEHLVVLFQPALFTRTQLHAGNFAAALSIEDADVVIAGVHGDREDPIPGVSSQSILDQMVVPEGSSAQVVEDLREAADVAASLARPGTQVMTVGSGTVTLAADWILDRLRDGSDG
ncbi:UDP-N-acetylmuramate--L-alanine ligase [Demequina sp. NBRC 110056]|uniref:UDP-N-acetylmuramate--L-alanine ligase n=1 Tax=Demequina sp. NBRC 110056 TaxID=1570345 RepID=UPI001F2D4D0B|nr:UDP-N-acetylmuramate--L-alanine ligase [Demequina sp. NBRC 110056]